MDIQSRWAAVEDVIHVCQKDIWKTINCFWLLQSVCLNLSIFVKKIHKELVGIPLICDSSLLKEYVLKYLQMVATCSVNTVGWSWWASILLVVISLAFYWELLGCWNMLKFIYITPLNPLTAKNGYIWLFFIVLDLQWGT